METRRTQLAARELRSPAILEYARCGAEGSLPKLGCATWRLRHLALESRQASAGQEPAECGQLCQHLCDLSETADLGVDDSLVYRWEKGEKGRSRPRPGPHYRALLGRVCEREAKNVKPDRPT